MNQLELSLSSAHHNQQLFSNHFLDVRLRDEDVWEQVAEEAGALRRELAARMKEQEAPLDAANEAQTEERWIKPVLRSLGWGFEVQPVSRRQGTTRFPDYALFEDQDDADAAASEKVRRRVLKRAVGVLEAKRWDRALDVGDPDDPKAPNRVPSAQIVNYLIRAEQPWGILTNGREWRLYFRDADFADTVYYAVDLRALLLADELPLSDGETLIPAEEAFRFFYLFFRPDAFVERPDRPRWLERVRRESLHYARSVEEALKPRAYRAVTVLCRGLARGQDLTREIVTEDEEEAERILDDALTILFRLLFILYAEARELLPVRKNAAYRNKSLLRLRERAAGVRSGENDVFGRGDDLWHDLHDLFRILDGDPRWRDVGVPVYNGGLFDPDQHPRLEDWYVPDPEMAEALDLLSRAEAPESGDLHLVDYGPLAVRHLGSVYEGLLEHRLRVAEEELPALEEKGRVVRDPVRPGELYLADDRGERKATGSFYTPSYVVDYIVEETLEPLVEGRSVGELLDLQILDPAMGSGHFLVAATSYLARAAVRATEDDPQEVLGDFARLDPQHLKRLVVERCIFGVDKNPRAVELAKLSLWIATVQREKPLNFLDHHLKHGDSLLGARVRRLGGVPGRTSEEARLEEEGGQYNAFDGAWRQQIFRVLSFVEQIEELPTESLKDIHDKEELHERSDAMLDRFRTTADLWCSRLFGNELTGDDYARVLRALKGPEEDWRELRSERWLKEAREVSEEHAFFHWKVEFGEVFYGERGESLEDAGFDAVIGNPPYVRMEEFKELKDFLRHEYRTYATRSDLYVYFVERSLDLLRDGGEYGAIVSNKFLRAKYGEGLRTLIGERSTVRQIVDFGGLPVFPEATVRSAVLLARREGGDDQVDVVPLVAEVETLDFERLGEYVDEIRFALEPDQMVGAEWLLVPKEVAWLIEKLHAGGATLGSIPVKICYGIKTGFNEAFFIDKEVRRRLIEEDDRSQEVIEPLVVGNQLHPYWIEPVDRWLLCLNHGIDIANYPAVELYLDSYRERLEGRATNQEWYELQQPQDRYQEAFSSSKIVYPDIAAEARFAWDAEGRYPANTSYALHGEGPWLLAFLNSRVALFALEARAAQLEGTSGDRYLRFIYQYMEKLPVPDIQETTPPEPRADLGRWLRSLYHRGLRLEGLEPPVPEEIRDLALRAAEVEDVERVLLVGSWARGDAEKGSDVDLVVVHRPDGTRKEKETEIRRRMGSVSRGLDLHLYSTEEFTSLRDRDDFLQRVLKEARVLYPSREGSTSE